jgi:hypothetical protein
LAARTKCNDQASTVTRPRPKTRSRRTIGLETQQSVATTLPATPSQRRRSGPAVQKPVEPAPELEFMQAMQDYKKSSGRMFPTWSEVLEVLQSLGYRKSDEDAVTTGSLVSESA